MNDVRSKKYQVGSLLITLPICRKDWDTLDKLDFLDVVLPTLIEAGAYDGSIEYHVLLGRKVFFECNDRKHAESIITALFKMLDEAENDPTLKPSSGNWR
jgi:hypothetical protein